MFNDGYGKRSLSGPRSRRRLLVDTAVISGLTAALLLLTYPLNLFDRFVEFSRAHWPLGEVAVVLVFVSFALIVFGVRRITDQHHELELRTAAEERAVSFAYFDQLTGLPNRRRFREEISATAAKDGRLDGILLLDLDGFTPVNDTVGQEGGDEALCVIADRLRSICDRCTMVARVGGDEFGLRLENLSSAEEAKQAAQTVLAAVREPIAIGGEEYQLQASVGMALIDDAELSTETFLKHANIALRHAKQQRTNGGYVIYEPGMDLAIRERMSLEQDLRRALDEGQFFPVYQPIVNLKTGAIVKFEALARWKHPVRGPVSPSRFIAIAEDTGLIRDVTDAILRQAFADARSWPGWISLSVNLSPVLLANDGYPLHLVTLINESGLHPYRLVVEITESALEADIKKMRRFIGQLHALGVETSLDDFGTGYSSLSRLRELPFHEIKIDQSFVRGIGNPESAAIVRSIIQLGRSLGVSLTAEGVEAPAEKAWLLAEGCHNGQGYLFGKPMDAAFVKEMLGRARTEPFWSSARQRRRVAT